MIRLLLTKSATDQISAHLAASAPLEEGAFCIVHEGLGRLGRRLVIDEVLLPGPGAWEVQHEGLLRPSAQWISAAVSEAIRRKAGLLFVHSHPNPGHPCGFSDTDVKAIHALGRTLAPMLDGVFAAAVVHPEGWAASEWRAEGMVPIDRIWSVGRTIQWLMPVTLTEPTRLDDRQRDALGRLHDYMRALDVAVVGCGGLGSPTAEQVVRIGARSILLNDLDRVDTPSNVRRILVRRMPMRKPRLRPPRLMLSVVTFSNSASTHVFAESTVTSEGNEFSVNFLTRTSSSARLIRTGAARCSMISQVRTCCQ
jgi:ThiF family